MLIDMGIGYACRYPPAGYGKPGLETLDFFDPRKGESALEVWIIDQGQNARQKIDDILWRLDRFPDHLGLLYCYQYDIDSVSLELSSLNSIEPDYIVEKAVFQQSMKKPFVSIFRWYLMADRPLYRNLNSKSLSDELLESQQASLLLKAKKLTEGGFFNVPNS